MRTGILDDVMKEYRRSKKKSPSWPDHPAAQAGIVVEEAGQLMQASLQWKYERAESNDDQASQRQKMRCKAIEVAASAIRFLENL